MNTDNKKQSRSRAIPWLHRRRSEEFLFSLVFALSFFFFFLVWLHLSCWFQNYSVTDLKRDRVLQLTVNVVTTILWLVIETYDVHVAVSDWIPIIEMLEKSPLMLMWWTKMWPKGQSENLTDVFKSQTTTLTFWGPRFYSSSTWI